MFQMYAVVRGTNDVCGGICIKLDWSGGYSGSYCHVGGAA